MHFLKYLKIIGLCLVVFTLGREASAQTSTAGDHTLPAFPAPPNPNESMQQTPAPSTGTPIPSSGSGDGYSYAPSEFDDFSIVYPADGTTPLYVSNSFLEHSIKSSNNGAQVVGDAKAYQQMNAQVAGQLEKQFYPDASAGNADVQRSVIEGAERDMIIEQDPKAGPYARVTVTDKEGNVISESSLSAEMARQISQNPYMDAEKKIDQLAKIQFTLPEKARENFDKLSAEDLRAMALENPALQNQEFVKFARVMAQVEAKKQQHPDADEAMKADLKSSGTDVTQIQDKVANRAQRKTDADDVSLDTMDTVPGDAPDKKARTKDTLRPQSGLGGPEIAGIALGIIAIGIFAFGWWKARQ